MKGKRNSKLKKVHPKYRDMKTTNHKIKECYAMSLSVQPPKHISLKCFFHFDAPKSQLTLQFSRQCTLTIDSLTLLQEEASPTKAAKIVSMQDPTQNQVQIKLRERKKNS